MAPRLRNDLYCVEWDVKPYYTIPFSGANSTVKGAAAYIQFIRYVFNSFAKASSDRALLRTTSGKPFQTRGAAAAKERSPKDVFILTTSNI